MTDLKDSSPSIEGENETSSASPDATSFASKARTRGAAVLDALGTPLGLPSVAKLTSSSELTVAGTGEVETKGAGEVAITAAATVAAVAIGTLVIAGPTLIVFGVGYWFGKRKKH